MRSMSFLEIEDNDSHPQENCQNYFILHPALEGLKNLTTIFSK